MTHLRVVLFFCTFVSMKRLLSFVALGLALISCLPVWTGREKEIITRSGSVMYVTVLQADSAVLRTPSVDFPKEAFQTEELHVLMEKMLSTVQDPSQDGVGIAAPQVGLNRRLIWVQRMDKAGEPFECYANVHIDSLIGPLVDGAEGCLSVPPLRGEVRRYASVIVSYTDPRNGENRQERVDGYTARIFQHECDHLDGVLYIDRADTIFTHTAWAQDRLQYNYDRPEWW